MPTRLLLAPLPRFSHLPLSLNIILPDSFAWLSLNIINVIRVIYEVPIWYVCKLLRTKLTT